MSGTGYLLLNFIDGSKVAIGFDKLETVKGKTSFIHDLALSMLPPNLSTVMTPDAVWYPEGGSRDGAKDALERILDGWMGLTLNEGSISKRVKAAVLHHIDDGFVVGEKWFGTAEEAVKEFKTMNYLIEEIVDNLRKDIYYGKIMHEQGNYYINEVMIVRQKNQEIINKLTAIESLLEAT